MKRASVATLGLLAHVAASSSSDWYDVVPRPDPWLPALDLTNVTWKEVRVCCGGGATSTTLQVDGSVEEVVVYETKVLGSIPQFTTEQSLHVLEHAREAWKGGMGEWTQMSLKQRIQAVRRVLTALQVRREQMVQTLMWEIGKNRNDAESEFDRTVQFAQHVMTTLETDPEFGGAWQTLGTTHAFVKRSAIGIFLSLAPFNYPLNECYAAIIPCLLMGNVVILKIPTVGGLVHLLTMDVFRETLPPGTIGFIAGSGRNTMPPLMATGFVDGLAFIGSSKAADDLIQHHPHPHRLKVFLQLEAKNMAIYLPDVFLDPVSFDNAIEQGVTGSLSYNGQRCTALKLHFVPTAYASTFVEAFVKRVESLSIGLAHANNPLITPLPSHDRVRYMHELIDDAVALGAHVVNQNGGTIIGGPESTLMIPAVLYPVTEEMKLFHEEQFGPVVPIAVYDSIDAVVEIGRNSKYGQQISIFVANDSEMTSYLVDRFSAVVGRVNINSQCSRSPDALPFSGRRSSAMGVMSIKEALREFSIPTVLAHSNTHAPNQALARGIEEKSSFLQPVV